MPKLLGKDSNLPADNKPPPRGSGQSLANEILEQTPQPLVTMDSEGLICSFSPAAEAVFGYAADEIIGENIGVLMPEPYADGRDGDVSRYPASGAPHVLGRRKGGEVFPIRLNVGQFVLQGRVYFVGVIQDISVEEDSNRRIRGLLAELDRQSRINALGEMAAGMAHELNQPLTAAAAFAEAADLQLEQQGLERTDPARREVERCLDEIHRTAAIIRNIREFVRRDAPDLQSCDLNAVVEDALLFCLGGPALGALEVRRHLAPDLPEMALDRVQIRQVVVDLIRNALEIMEGSDRRRLEVSTGFDGDSVEIRVADSGPGIDPVLQGRLFEPFTTNRRESLGLGLAIARTIVESHGGKLAAESGTPQGAVFTVRLPVRQAGQEEQ